MIESISQELDFSEQIVAVSASLLLNFEGVDIVIKQITVMPSDVHDVPLELNVLEGYVFDLLLHSDQPIPNVSHLVCHSVVLDHNRVVIFVMLLKIICPHCGLLFLNMPKLVQHLHGSLFDDLLNSSFHITFHVDHFGLEFSQSDLHRGYRRLRLRLEKSKSASPIFGRFTLKAP